MFRCVETIPPRLIYLVALIVAVCTTQHSAVEAQPRLYNVIDLGLSTPSHLNNRGVVSIRRRNVRTADAFGRVYYATIPFAGVWEFGRERELRASTTYEYAAATSVNSNSQVVGWAHVFGQGCVSCPVTDHAVVWQPDGTSVVLPNLPASATRAAMHSAQAHDINDHGTIVGYSWYGVMGRGGLERAVVWRNNESVELGPFEPGLSGRAYSINNAEQIVGDAEFTRVAGGPGPRRAALWADGAMADLGSFGGISGTSIAYDINDAQQIVGSSSTTVAPAPFAAPYQHAFVWQNGAMTDLGTLGGYVESRALAINSRGQIVGVASQRPGPPTFEPDERAVIWNGGVITDLNSLVASDSGWVLFEASDINDDGRIVGRGALNGELRFFMLEPPSAAPPCVAPLAPQLSGSVTGSLVNLAWTRVAGATNYTLHVGTAPGITDVGQFAQGASTSLNTTAPDGRWFVRVTASNACAASAASNEIVLLVGTAPVPPLVPGAPSNVTVDVVGSRVTLRWQAPSSGGPVSTYLLEAFDVSGRPLGIFDIGAATIFEHSAVAPGTYVVHVRAMNAAGRGPASAPIVVTVPAR